MGGINMLCEKCNKRQATVHLTKVINGKKTEIHLCEQCAKKGEQITFDNSFSINNFLTSLIDSVQDSPLKVDYIQTKKCDRCGMTYGKFKQLGRLGCPDCYNVFSEKLNILIKNIQGSENHTGKVPKKAGNSLRIKNEIKNIKIQLNDAIQKEEFEKAAVLRDKIKELENRLNS
jgi:protein arginine kinase activator